VPDAGHLVPHAVDHVEVVAVRAQHGRPGVVHDVDEVVGGKPVVDRHQHRAGLGDGIERLELRVGVRRDGGDPVTRLDAQPLQRGRPPVAAVEELLVGQPEAAVDDRLAGAVQSAGAAGEVQRRQRCFHRSA